MVGRRRPQQRWDEDSGHPALKRIYCAFIPLKSIYNVSKYCWTLIIPTEIITSPSVTSYFLWLDTYLWLAGMQTIKLFNILIFLKILILLPFILLMITVCFCYYDVYLQKPWTHLHVNTSSFICLSPLHIYMFRLGYSIFASLTWNRRTNVMYCNKLSYAHFSWCYYKLSKLFVS